MGNLQLWSEKKGLCSQFLGSFDWLKSLPSHSWNTSSEFLRFFVLFYEIGNRKCFMRTQRQGNEKWELSKLDLNNYDYLFSDVSSHLYKRVCLSVHLSVRRLRLFKNLISRLRSCNESNDLYMYPVSPPTVMPEIQAICAKFTPCSKTIKTHRYPVGLVYFYFSLYVTAISAKIMPRSKTIRTHRYPVGLVYSYISLYVTI